VQIFRHFDIFAILGAFHIAKVFFRAIISQAGNGALDKVGLASKFRQTVEVQIVALWDID
jgi:hypothetical protein